MLLVVAAVASSRKDWYFSRLQSHTLSETWILLGKHHFEGASSASMPNPDPFHLNPDCFEAIVVASFSGLLQAFLSALLRIQMPKNKFNHKIARYAWLTASLP